MSNSFSPPTPDRKGAGLRRTPSHRQQASRRRIAIAGAVLGLALASAAIGALVRPPAQLPQQASTGPFSYFPAS